MCGDQEHPRDLFNFSSAESTSRSRVVSRAAKAQKCPPAHGFANPIHRINGYLFTILYGVSISFRSTTLRVNRQCELGDVQQIVLFALDAFIITGGLFFFHYNAQTCDFSRTIVAIRSYSRERIARIFFPRLRDEMIDK